MNGHHHVVEIPLATSVAHNLPLERVAMQLIGIF